MEQNLTHDTLPQGVTQLIKEVSELKSLLIQKQEAPTQQTEEPLTIQQAAAFLKLSVATIYTKVSKGELPNYKRGKRLYFSKTELLEYLKEGRKQTNKDIEAAAEQYLSNNKTGLKL